MNVEFGGICAGVVDDFASVEIHVDESAEHGVGGNEDALEFAVFVAEFEFPSAAGFGGPKETGPVGRPTWYALIEVDPGFVVFDDEGFGFSCIGINLQEGELGLFAILESEAEGRAFVPGDFG